MKPSPHLILLRPRSRLLLHPLSKPTTPLLTHHHPTRPFTTNPLTPTPQTLHATRILPHPAPALYALIADIESYPTFLPYVTSSRITARTAPSPRTRTTYPQAATLRVGWGPYSEEFHSKIFCVPHSVVEAVSGPAATTSLTAADLPHHDADSLRDTVDNGVFERLVTRWTLTEYPFKPLPPDGKSPQEGKASLPSRPQTEVGLKIEVTFKSAVYAALSQAAAGKVAGMLVRAFEERAREVLGEGEGGPEEVMRRGDKGGEGVEGKVAGP